MSKLKARKIVSVPAEKLGGWDALIAEAKRRIVDLEFSIKVFERKKEANAPFPPVPQSDSGLIAAATHN